MRTSRPLSVRIRLGFLVILGLAVAVLMVPAGGWAADLKDVVARLYGGDGIRLQPTPPPFPSHDPHFVAASLAGLDNLGRAITSNINTFSFNSSVTGFTFDIELGVPVRSTESLGPLLAERAPTLGAGKLNLGFSYTRVDFTRFRGKRLDELELVFSHEDSNGDGVIGVPEFELDQVLVDLDLTVRQEIFALFATYGLTPRWDLGVVVPIVKATLRADAHATIVRNSAISTFVHNFGPDSDPPDSRGGGERTGIGDVILRTKYNFLRNAPVWPDLAVLGQVKLPTGDDDNLLGTGETDFLGMLIASRALGPVTPHVNLGYELSTAGAEEHNLRYVAGFDARLHPRLAVAADVLGRWKPEGDGIGDHIIDLALGARWNVFRSLLLNANVQVPLNKNQGLRADVIWTVGFDYTF